MSEEKFDFEAHSQSAVSEYLRSQTFYSDFAAVIARVIEDCLRNSEIEIHSIQHRAKSASSLERKALTPHEADPNKPKYDRPLELITDLAGVRIITHFPSTLPLIDEFLNKEFLVVERSDKSERLVAEDRFGYRSIHYLVKLRPERAALAEYARYGDKIAEVQIRTILQHAWAEIEHDIQYKSAESIPTELRRRFMALAGMLEVADREFEAIQSVDRGIVNKAKEGIKNGDLADVEITPTTLKFFLDKRVGADARISDWSYDWTARVVRSLGFKDLRQVESAIKDYDDDKLNYIVAQTRQGPTTRFEFMLLAALGEQFIKSHPYKDEPWFMRTAKKQLSEFTRNGVVTATYKME